jgi:hypothetical protein
MLNGTTFPMSRKWMLQKSREALIPPTILRKKLARMSVDERSKKFPLSGGRAVPAHAWFSFPFKTTAFLGGLAPLREPPVWSRLRRSTVVLICRSTVRLVDLCNQPFAPQ